MDFKKRFFELERLSPLIAKRAWKLASFVLHPDKGFGFDLIHFTDSHIEVGLNENQLGLAGWIAVAERGVHLLWGRHIEYDSIELRVSEVHGRSFLESGDTATQKMGGNKILLRCELTERERLDLLREVLTRGECNGSIQVGLFDGNGKALGAVDFVFSLFAKASSQNLLNDPQQTSR